MSSDVRIHNIKDHTATGKGYRTLCNSIFKSNLTASQLGVLVYLLSKPPHWKLNTIELQKRFKMGANAMQKQLNELKAMRYIVMSGHGASIRYDVHEVPYVEVEEKQLKLKL